MQECWVDTGKGSRHRSRHGDRISGVSNRHRGERYPSRRSFVDLDWRLGLNGAVHCEARGVGLDSLAGLLGGVAGVLGGKREGQHCTTEAAKNGVL